ncbi:NACHT domain-containing protein [Hymenobacter oligotrophus]|uniref:NACHT domain-containing protein n=1 Tax=Hymenobacter oligotrophus TaxID=2319843 RepID=A0A3B7QW80_9BACT|nr:NACHT domain-containing protein [Hymenobacter oligotrophus]AYA36064.1 NACHT domain-containing protein [Hymenobacter oligotrophus]
MQQDKVNIIENINSIDELGKILETVLANMGLQDINRKQDGSVICIQKDSLGEQKLCFVPITEKVKGKNDVIETRVSALAKENFDSIFIVISKFTSSGTEISNYFKELLLKKFPNTRIVFWSRNNIIETIDKHYNGFWSHSDIFIKPYEEYYITSSRSDFELRNLLKLDDKYQNLLDIFVEPTLCIYIEDKEAKRPIKRKFSFEKIIKSGSYIVSGEAGTGKSTLLQHIGKSLIIENSKETPHKNIPIFVKQSDLISNDFDINKSVQSILLNVYKFFDLEKLFSDYTIVILIDSIDELDKDKQKTILKDLDAIRDKGSSRFIIATRSHEHLVKDCELNEYTHVTVEDFSIKQIQLFLKNFFRSDENKANKLLSSLRDNKILEKVPVTPLTLSVISILYEEKQYEIPATVTDVYDNFNIFLLGRATVKSNLEFLDINIKERILSHYALYILTQEDRIPQTEAEFKAFIELFFSARSMTIEKKNIPELFNALTQGTGVLFVDEGSFVCFKHNYFMEYYASLEIFKQKRELENELVERFTEFNWQNTSIFYAGRTKDMSDFLSKVIKKVKQYETLTDCLMATSGMGYLLQALWLTDANIRKEGTLAALDLMIKSLENMSRLSYEKSTFFSGLQYPSIALINALFFFKNFNSITLKDPIILAFDELMESEKRKMSLDEHTNNQQLHGLEVIQRETLYYKLFNLALVLYSERINSNEKLSELFDNTYMLNNPLFLMLFDKGLDMINPKNSDAIKDEENFASKKNRYLAGMNFYVSNTADKLRFTNFENISSYKRVELYTEGKTDAEIIERANYVLTRNKYPYWSVRSCGSVKHNIGGADELKNFLETIGAQMLGNQDKDKVIIGIFDNDMAGNRCHGGLKKELFNQINERVKKHKECEVYAIKLPIPIEKDVYLKSKPEFKFFSIEHYFPTEFLKSHDMLRDIPDFQDVYNINDKKKAEFATIIQQEEDASVFEDFKFLFEEIDFLSNEKTQYID